MSGTAPKRVESRREADTYTASTGTVFAIPPIPWRARNKLADLVISQDSSAIERALEKDGSGDVTTVHLRDSVVPYDEILALGLGKYTTDPVTPEPMTAETSQQIDMLPHPDLVALTVAVLERNGLDRLVHMVDLGKPRPESLLGALGFALANEVGGASDDGQKTSSAPDSPSPDSPDETLTT